MPKLTAAQHKEHERHCTTVTLVHARKPTRMHSALDKPTAGRPEPQPPEFLGGPATGNGPANINWRVQACNLSCMSLNFPPRPKVKPLPQPLSVGYTHPHQRHHGTLVAGQAVLPSAACAVCLPASMLVSSPTAPSTQAPCRSSQPICQSKFPVALNLIPCLPKPTGKPAGHRPLPKPLAQAAYTMPLRRCSLCNRMPRRQVHARLGRGAAAAPQADLQRSADTGPGHDGGAVP